MATMTLVPQVVDAVKIPVIAAGGIADGRGFAAALMLGAQGVQMGTRFLCAEECVAHENYKKKVLAARDIDTIVTGRRLGHPVRALKNPFTNEFAGLSTTPPRPTPRLNSSAWARCARPPLTAMKKEGSFLCGQIAGLVTRIQPAAEIIDDVLEGAEKLLRGAPEWIK